MLTCYNVDRHRDSSYHRRDGDRDRDRSRNRNTSHHRSRDRNHSRSRSHRDRDRDDSRDRSREDRHSSQRTSNRFEIQPPKPANDSSTSTQPINDAQMNSAIIAAMQAARNIKMDRICECLKSAVAQPQKKRVSRFSNNLLTKKIYFPQQNFDIDYMAIFNGPARSTLEADTHTTIRVGGSAVVVVLLSEW